MSTSGEASEMTPEQALTRLDGDDVPWNIVRDALADRDRWIRRVRVLEGRLARIRIILEAP